MTPQMWYATVSGIIMLVVSVLVYYWGLDRQQTKVLFDNSIQIAIANLKSEMAESERRAKHDAIADITPRLQDLDLKKANKETCETQFQDIERRVGMIEGRFWQFPGGVSR